MSANVQGRCTEAPLRETAAMIAARAVTELAAAVAEHDRRVEEAKTARRHMMLVMHRSGVSLAHIGKLTGLSKSTVAEHINKAACDEKRLDANKLAAARTAAARALAAAIPEQMTRPLTQPRALEAV